MAPERIATYTRAYLSELVERAVRLQLHLELVQEQFFPSNSSQSGDRPDKVDFLRSYRDYVTTILTACAHLNALICDDHTVLERVLHQIEEGFRCLNSLHARGLVHLPRPAEPIELRRFCRIINKHILSATGASHDGIAIYLTENTSEESFVADPISELKEIVLDKFVSGVNGLMSTATLETPPASGIASSHVTIARIDANNPCRWPTLVHEVAHKILPADIFPANDIEDGFRQGLGERAEFSITKLGINLRSWLIELWCDLFAALVMGPSLFFSQYSALLQTPSPNEISSTHPPASFRLRMIRHLLTHRYPDLLAARCPALQIAAAIDLADFLDERKGHSVRTMPYLRQVFQSIWSYFQENFFGSHASEPALADKMAKMIRHVKDLKADQLNLLVKQLGDGLPIPSKRVAGQTSPLAEDPTSIQEILLAGWVLRQNRVTQSLLTDVAKLNQLTALDQVMDNVRTSIHRFDQSLLRSIQVGEWLHLYSESAPVEPSAPLSAPSSAAASSTRRSMLVDHEIESLLVSDQLRVVPFLSIGRPLGSSSLDIRLGTSFQVYFPRWRRTQNDYSLSNPLGDSKLLDLDYLEHIILLPGQFMLGHSLEYLRFPDEIAAELDGRSTYARLGLEVHMTAGFIDPGFEGVVTFELFNAGANPILLFPGYRVAQLRLFAVTAPQRPYSRNEKAKYRGLLQHNQSLYSRDPEARVIIQAMQAKSSNLT